MMFNTTYKNKANEELIKDIVGNAFTFFEVLKLKGVGSKRMMIKEVSPNFRPIINKTPDINYANIELRKGGILIHINKGLQNYSWAIPYYQLHTYKIGGFSIHAQGNYIRFKNNKLLKENKRFFEKLVNFKVEFDQQYEFQL